MAQQTNFDGGQKAPNNGLYIEVGEDDFGTPIQDPKSVRMKAGDRLPETTTDGRKWKRKKD